MKICGFSIIKNGEKFDYPMVESIKSALPLVDKFIVGVGDGDDNTEEIIRNIKSDKIEIINTVWPEKLSAGGYYLSGETNKIFDMIGPEYNWCIYLQADEVLHEEDYPVMLKAMKKYKGNKDVDGFIFNWKHFWGDYKYLAYGRQWYRRDVRIIRNDKSIRSWRGAQGFRKTNGEKPTCVSIDAYIYHYGWVRHPKYMQKKVQNCNWNQEFWTAENMEKLDFDYNRDYDCVLNYTGNHPSIMKKRIDEHSWEVNIDPKVRKYSSKKDSLLMWFERLTGHRLAENQHFHVYGKGKRLTNLWDESLF